MKKDNLESRRVFFKKAAKSTLPVLGAIILFNPLIANATKIAMGCQGSCYTGCDGGCRKSCSGSCRYHCLSTCKGGCQRTSRGY